MDKDQFVRTMSIIRELAKGKHLTLPSGHKIAMGVDMTIGFVMTNETTGEQTVGGLLDMSIKQLNALLEGEGIGMAIPGDD